jgi:hypothetical protein
LNVFFRRHKETEAMTVSHAHRLAALVLALMLSACQREAAPAADAVDQPETTPTPQAPAASEVPTVPGTDAIETVDNGPLDPQARSIGGVDVRAFAGVFSTEGARIEFKPDGTYAMTVHAASANADLESSGTWTAQAAGNEILLDPDDKSESDHGYVVVSNNEIWEINGGGRVLHRQIAQ